MKFKIIFLTALTSLSILKTNAQSLDISADWSLRVGDSLAWADVNYKDSHWEKLSRTDLWENVGHENYDGYGWYRKKLAIPSSLKSDAEANGFLNLYLGKVDDADETYFNGKLLGSTGSFPPKYEGKYNDYRIYKIDKNKILWDKENLIAVRVYDQMGGGGMPSGSVRLVVPSENVFKVTDKSIDGFPLSEGQTVYTKKIVIPASFQKVAVKNNGMVLTYDLLGELSLFLNGKPLPKSKGSIGNPRIFVPVQNIVFGKANDLTLYISKKTPMDLVLFSVFEFKEPTWVDFLSSAPLKSKFISGEYSKPFDVSLELGNAGPVPINGSLFVELTSDIYKVEDSKKQEIVLKANSKNNYNFKLSPMFYGPYKIQYRFVENQSKESINGVISYGIVEEKK